jgi:hypothetical protein
MWNFLLLSPLFKRKSLIMKNISTGFGLCAIAAAVALYPVLDRFAPISKEAHAGVPASAITSAVMGQAAPTIVWYGSDSGTLIRAWSDGRIEGKHFTWNFSQSKECGYFYYAVVDSCPEWAVMNNPTQGLSAASDSNFDSKVDSTDLAMLLGNWGDAPRHDIPPSDCPLNLINP